MLNVEFVDCLSFRARAFRCIRRHIDHVIWQVEGRICLLFTISMPKNHLQINQMKTISLLSQFFFINLQCSFFIGFIIAHNYGLSCRPAMMMSSVVRRFPAIFTLLLGFCIIVPHSGFTTEMRLYIARPPVFASVTINTEKDHSNRNHISYV